MRTYLYIIMFFVSIILVIFLTLFFKNVYDDSVSLNYKIGYNDALINVITGIQNTGNIPYIQNGTVKYVAIKDLCGEVE